MRNIVTLLAGLVALQTPSIAQAQSDPTIVAVLDTGIAEVGALTGRVRSTYDLYSVNEPREELRSSHGTMVANIIAERTAHDVQFIAMRVDTDHCKGEICEVDEEALRRAVRLSIDLDVDVIQASLTGRMRRETRDLFVEAANSGITVVLASGNHGGLSLAGMILSEVEDNVHVVASLDHNGRPSEFSARLRGRLRDHMIWRPGEEIATINRAGESTLATGTSFAAPIYASELLAKLEVQPHLGSAEVDADLQPTAASIEVDLMPWDGQTFAAQLYASELLNAPELNSASEMLSSLETEASLDIVMEGRETSPALEFRGLGKDLLASVNSSLLQEDEQMPAYTSLDTVLAQQEADQCPLQILAQANAKKADTTQGPAASPDNEALKKWVSSMMRMKIEGTEHHDHADQHRPQVLADLRRYRNPGQRFDPQR